MSSQPVDDGRPLHASSPPSRPVNIGSPRLVSQDASDLFTSRTPQGTPDVRELRAHFGTPPVDLPPPNPAITGTSLSSPQVALSSSPPRPSSGAATPPDLNLFDELSDVEKAKVIRRHLVSRDARAAAGPGAGESPSPPGTPGSAAGGQSSHPHENSEAFPIPYHLPGGDVTHDIYRWQSERLLRPRRSASFSGMQRERHPAFEHIREPGGFRRNYMLLRAEEQGLRGNEDGPVEGNRNRMLNSFIDFLYIYGHFAGEDLEEEEEEEEEEEDLHAAANVNNYGGGTPHPRDSRFPKPSFQAETETSPLLRRISNKSRRRSRRLSSSSGGPHGDATVFQTVLMLLKAFIGTGVLFMGKAFYNGGILFSTITLTVIGLISLWCFLLLAEVKHVLSGSFGDMGGALYGQPMRLSILSSVAISQIGFTCAYTIFTASNLQAFILAVTDCKTYISNLHLILAQLIVFLPLAMIRNLTKLSVAVLIADAFILVGLIYLFGNELSVIASHGIADVQLFNPKNYALLIGTSVFSFEGVGLVVPITDSMREPHKFPRALTGVMFFLITLFGGAGFITYAAYGKDVQTVALVNLPQDKMFSHIVQLLYSIAILLSIPLQLFPAVRIMENGIFTRSGKMDPRVKWEKNVFRFCIVLVCTVISWIGANDLDKFVAFVGSFACVPLCYVYPPLMHYKACARTRWQKGADIALVVFGVSASIFTTVQTLHLMVQSNGGSGPKLGNCEL